MDRETLQLITWIALALAYAMGLINMVLLYRGRLRSAPQITIRSVAVSVPSGSSKPNSASAAEDA